MNEAYTSFCFLPFSFLTRSSIHLSSWSTILSYLPPYYPSYTSYLGGFTAESSIIFLYLQVQRDFLWLEMFETCQRASSGWLIINGARILVGLSFLHVVILFIVIVTVRHRYLVLKHCWTTHCRLGLGRGGLRLDGETIFNIFIQVRSLGDTEIVTEFWKGHVCQWSMNSLDMIFILPSWNMVGVVSPCTDDFYGIRFLRQHMVSKSPCKTIDCQLWKFRC